MAEDSESPQVPQPFETLENALKKRRHLSYERLRRGGAAPISGDHPDEKLLAKPLSELAQWNKEADVRDTITMLLQEIRNKK